MRGIVFYIKASRPAIWEELYFTSRFLAQLYERNCILHQGFSPSYMRGIVFYIKVSPPRYMRGIVFYIKTSRPAIWEELKKPWYKIQFLSYSWARSLDVKYNYIKVSSPAIWEELYFTSRFLAQRYERNYILHQGFSPSYMRGIVFYIKASRPAIWEELYFTSRLLAQLYERNCILHQGFSPSYMRGIVEKPWCKIQFLSYSWASNLDVKYNSSHIAGRVTLM
jgi:hypothetical protein